MRNPFRRQRQEDSRGSEPVLVNDVWYPAEHGRFLADAPRRGRHRAGSVESRTISSMPWVIPFNVGGPAHPSGSLTRERAMMLAPVYAANRLLADNISTLPIKAYRRVADTRQPMPGLPQLFALLADDGAGSSRLVPWLSQLVISLGLHGNAVGIVTSRDGMQFPTAVSWLNPTLVDCDDRNPAAPIWRYQGRQLDLSEIVHIPWLSLPGKVWGLAPVEAFALTVDGGLAAKQFGLDWFNAGGVPPGTFKNAEQKVTQDEADVIKRRLVNAIKSREPIVYGSDWDFNAITIPPNQAQFIETAHLTATEIAAAYGLPPEELGGATGGSSITYANIEQRQTNLALRLRPWLVRIETALSALLPNRQYVKFNADALIRADIKTRHEVYAIDREIGLRNIDEIRAIEDQPPLPDGKGQDYTPMGKLVSPPVSPLSR